MDAHSIKFRVQNRLADLKTLNRHLQAFADRQGLSEKCVFEINFTLEEILANIISYAYGDAERHWIEVCLSVADDTLTIRVKDDGRYFNLFEVLPPDFDCPLDDRKVGGLGIFFIRKFMDRIVYERQPDANLLTLKKHIRR